MVSSIDLYRVFYYVGKYKNITHAASTLFISQSTVSRCIKNLENELGCQLLERSQHGVEFTAEGSLLYSYVASACESLLKGEEKLKEMQETGEGTIRIGVNDFTFQQFVLPVMKEFRSDFPGVKLEVEYLSSELGNTALDNVAEGSYSFLCMSLHAPIHRSDLVYETAAKFSDVVIAGKEYAPLLGQSHTLAELIEKYPFVAETGEDAFFSRLCQSHSIQAEAAFRVNSVSMFLPMVAQGMCLAILPDTYLIESPDVFEIPITDPLPERNIWLISSRTSNHSSVQDELMHRIKRYCRLRSGNTGAAKSNNT